MQHGPNTGHELSAEDIPSRVVQRFWSRVDKGPGCWEWTGGKSYGYGQLGWSENGEKIRILTHRISKALHHGPVPARTLVRHSCDNPGCVNPDHLLLGTHVDNMADRKGKPYKKR